MKTVCVDLDGVLAKYHGWPGDVTIIGNPIPGAYEFLEKLSQVANVVVFTTRLNTDVNEGHTLPELTKIICDWLSEHMPPGIGLYAGSGKPLAAAYIDDKAITCRSQEKKGEFTETLCETIRLLTNGLIIKE